MESFSTPCLYFSFSSRVRINLRELPLEVTNNLWCDVENGDGRLNVIVTITGTTRGDSPSNLDNWDMECLPKLQEQYLERYVSRTFWQKKNVGTLSKLFHRKCSSNSIYLYFFTYGLLVQHIKDSYNAVVHADVIYYCFFRNWKIPSASWRM